MAKTILLTGFPGFIGARLIPKLLADEPGAKVVALVEPRMVARAREVAPDGVEVVEGDITRGNLGLGDAQWHRLIEEVDTVFHLAAIYDLAVPLALAERVNVTGTANVLQFCRACTSLDRLDYVSTAYVAGLRSGLVLEDELYAGQEFKNHYESTKFAAEVLVRAAMQHDGIPTTIYRPAIVVGDSKTGETSKFDGPYYMLRTVAASRGVLPQIGNPDALFNCVPVDFVVDGMAAGAKDPKALGKTLHLTDPEPLPSAEVFSLLAREYDGRTPSFQVPLGLLDRSLKYAPVRAFYGGTPRESVRYLNHPVRFDVSNAAEVLAPHGLRCPRFAEYVPNMVRFFKDHEDDAALKPGG